MDELAEVAPSIAVARADAHSLRGIILAGSNAEAAEREFATALERFSAMASNPALGHSPDLHLRLGDLLLNLASLARTVRGGDGAPTAAAGNFHLSRHRRVDGRLAEYGGCTSGARHDRRCHA